MKNQNIMMTAAMALLAAGTSSRIFGASNIERYLQRQKRDHMRGAEGSIATGNRWGGPHLHTQEIARNRRRTAR